MTLAHFFNVAGPDLLVLLVILLLLGFPIWMLVDCINNEPSQDNYKLIWVLVIIFAPLGSVIYFFARKVPRKPAA